MIVEEKSNAEDIEKERLLGRGRFSVSLLFDGSVSVSRESFLEEGRPEEEDVDSVEERGDADEDAREASSSESRFMECCGGYGGMMWRDRLERGLAWVRWVSIWWTGSCSKTDG